MGAGLCSGAPMEQLWLLLSMELELGNASVMTDDLKNGALFSVLGLATATTLEFRIAPFIAPRSSVAAGWFKILVSWGATRVVTLAKLSRREQAIGHIKT